jgi:hypothetical protein
MIKKKAKSKKTKKATRKRISAKSKKEKNPADVRKEISQMVHADAAQMAGAVIGEGKKGKLATVRYLFEMANIFPIPKEGEQATEEDDSLAKLLLARLTPPLNATKEEDEKLEGEAAEVAAVSETRAGEESAIGGSEEQSGAETESSTDVGLS